MANSTWGETLLFVHTGLDLSLPYSFLRKLAGRFDAQLLTPDSMGAATPPPTDPLDSDFGKLLQAGTNIVCKEPLNTKAERDQVRSMAEKVGSISVILMQAETDREAIERQIDLRSMTQKDPGLWRVRKSQHIFGEQSEQLESPSETGEEHVLLNGAQTSDKLVAAVTTYVKQRRADAWQPPGV